MEKKYAQKHYLPKCILLCVAKLTKQVLSIPRAARVSSYEVFHPIASTMFLLSAVSAGGGGQGAFQLDMGTQESRGKAGKSETRSQKKWKVRKAFFLFLVLNVLY